MNSLQKIFTLAVILFISLSFQSFSQKHDGGNIKTTQINTNGFFTLNNIDNKWWLINPEGNPFFSIGLNHIDPASLRYPENIHIWKEQYNGSTTEWLKNSVRKNMLDWGFNTMGWEQEVTVLQARGGDIDPPAGFRGRAPALC